VLADDDYIRQHDVAFGRDNVILQAQLILKIACAARSSVRTGERHPCFVFLLTQAREIIFSRYKCA
jgi:hypothetical protein